MGKIWMKTRFDAGMNMDIPHSINIANAMFGFREMGAEIVPYHLIDEIYESVERQDIVLDYIDQCNAIFRKFGVTPRIPDYPDVFKEFMGRRMERRIFCKTFAEQGVYRKDDQQYRGFGRLRELE